ncbi:hypothetical protein [Desmospora profundinema]|uniref:Uncharacterized protein n=1 Tax=Desmospora profundinema TaxID=1571184 RepID=A0ABU1IIJ5_9BACL|nr:hypothetical protein [Desmospora profundinema]MDR6224592.1 hypothetical protein [Desmospora profundinema]
MEEQKPLVLRLMQRKEDGSVSAIDDGSPRASWIRPKRKLRLLRAYTVTFIRGPRDRSPWRSEGRRHQLSVRGTHRERSSWSDRAAQRRMPPRAVQERWARNRGGRG